MHIERILCRSKNFGMPEVATLIKYLGYAYDITPSVVG